MQSINSIAEASRSTIEAFVKVHLTKRALPTQTWSIRTPSNVQSMYSEMGSPAPRFACEITVRSKLQCSNRESTTTKCLKLRALKSRRSSCWCSTYRLSSLIPGERPPVVIFLAPRHRVDRSTDARVTPTAVARQETSKSGEPVALAGRQVRDVRAHREVPEQAGIGGLDRSTSRPADHGTVTGLVGGPQAQRTSDTSSLRAPQTLLSRRARSSSRHQAHRRVGATPDVHQPAQGPGFVAPPRRASPAVRRRSPCSRRTRWWRGWRARCPRQCGRRRDRPSRCPPW
ncbi:hypothetical protein OCAE111667_18010 [Occultella aeris]|uniref:Uncharacterized protein n=1 Tax=Occultella aeris TaxID=2761496 RepID=A0A7M4DNM0_9MICO|nr:hypothetical protein HALOF300_03751 [Occultella aeris]